MLMRPCSEFPEYETALPGSCADRRRARTTSQDGRARKLTGSRGERVASQSPFRASGEWRQPPHSLAVSESMNFVGRVFTCENAVQKRLSALAAPQGFEPRYADPESAVLPLNEGAVILGWSQPIAGPF